MAMADTNQMLILSETYSAEPVPEIRATTVVAANSPF
jgi:hypothetical protein